ncbi:hypothetical protein Cgig2_029319 [Carnegiea gigantea]|uniref:Uncharacterized protein n=1 Tax=Carnegiea gigantea TaxID=171969 RepID=A0A9Q1KWN2_9CARY|nr:hypothetical protein Cgig2_029319 [Carnegiea gigantea]
MSSSEGNNPHAYYPKAIDRVKILLHREIELPLMRVLKFSKRLSTFYIDLFHFLRSWWYYYPPSLCFMVLPPNPIITPVFLQSGLILEAELCRKGATLCSTFDVLRNWVNAIWVVSTLDIELVFSRFCGSNGLREVGIQKRCISETRAGLVLHNWPPERYRSQCWGDVLPSPQVVVAGLLRQKTPRTVTMRPPGLWRTELTFTVFWRP